MLRRIQIFCSFLILPILVSTLNAQDFSSVTAVKVSFTDEQNLNWRSNLHQHLAPDKAKHFMGSLITTVFIYKICQTSLSVNHRSSKIYASGITFGVGFSKELLDRSHPKNIFSWKDLLANVAGISVGLVLANQP